MDHILKLVSLNFYFRLTKSIIVLLTTSHTDPNAEIYKPDDIFGNCRIECDSLLIFCCIKSVQKWM